MYYYFLNIVLVNTQIIFYILILDRKQLDTMGQDMFEITDRWQRLLIEMNSVNTMLQHTVEHWKRYAACTDILTVWLTNAEQQLNQPTQDQVSNHNIQCNCLIVCIL